MTKSRLVNMLIVFPTPDEVGDGGSTIGSGIGERNLYLCAGSRFPVCEGISENDLQ